MAGAVGIAAVLYSSPYSHPYICRPVGFVNAGERRLCSVEGKGYVVEGGRRERRNRQQEVVGGCGSCLSAGQGGRCRRAGIDRARRTCIHLSIHDGLGDATLDAHRSWGV
jgi:hypothetical protein